MTGIGVHAFDSCSSLTDINIPEGMTIIAHNIFRYCNSLTDIVIPEGVTTIETGAFSQCEALSGVAISGTVTAIGENAFSDTLCLKNRQQENPLVIVNGILIDGQMCVGDVTLPDTVTSIQSNAFGTSSNITSLVIPESVAFINSYAITNILDEAFYDVTGNGDGITLSDAQMILKYALKISSSKTNYTLSDAQMCLKLALKLVTL